MSHLDPHDIHDTAEQHQQPVTTHNCNQSTIYVDAYDPPLLGYTYTTASFSAPSQRNNHLHYDPRLDFHPRPQASTMDTTSVVIGRGKGSKFHSSHPANRKEKFVDENIDVCIGDELVREMPLRQLTRFSRLAAKVFPRPSGMDGQVTEKKPLDWADPEESDVDVKAMTDQVKALSAANKKPAVTKKPAPKDATTDTAKELNGKVNEAEKKPNRKLILLLQDVAELPKAAAVKYCLGWMGENKGRHNGQSLLWFQVPALDGRFPLSSYIDMYAAVIPFDLRPFPKHLVEAIMEHLTTYKASAADVAYVHEHLPFSDGVMTRMVTSVYEHNENEHYTEQEWNAIFDYVGTIKPLEARFKEVAGARKRFHHREQREQREADARERMQRGWAAVAGTAGGQAQHPARYQGQEQARTQAQAHVPGANGNKNGSKKRRGRPAGQARQESDVAGSSSEGSAKTGSDNSKEPKAAEKKGGKIAAYKAMAMEIAKKAAGATDGLEKDEQESNGRGVAGKHIPGV
ncbi:hypothetical protein LTR53_015250 [Teratosphaeriaceae sp. CCFEE 6253]|nr:hypothetical protein LTR53_015250 [Teratosphaeriaceae sp. CCFEE 6253]